MYVCICRAVTDRAIDAAVDAGAGCVDEVSWATGAATGCGSCREDVAARVERRLASGVEVAPPGALPALA